MSDPVTKEDLDDLESNVMQRLVGIENLLLQTKMATGAASQVTAEHIEEAIIKVAKVNKVLPSTLFQLPINKLAPKLAMAINKMRNGT